jgi:phage protein D
MSSPAIGVQPGTPPAVTRSLDDFYVPAYRVALKGQNQPELQQDILSVTYRDTLTDVDSVELVVDNWDPGDPVPGQAVQGQFRYHNTHTFDPWQDIQVWMGYYRQGADNLQLMMTGEIVTMAPSFPASGGSTLNVRALNLLHQFRTQQKTRDFTGKTDSQIAQLIVQDINTDIKKKLTNIQIQMLPQEVSDNITKNNEQPIPFLEMHNQYPIVFLMQRSRDTGYDISFDDVTDPSTNMRTITFHYRSSASVQRPTYVLEWGKSLISFQPTLQTAKQVGSVTVTGWNVQTKQPITQTVTRADLVKAGEKVVAPEDLGVTENSLSQKLEIVVDRGFNDPAEAKKVALKTLRQLAQGLVTAKGKTIGLPDLRAGSKVNICMKPGDNQVPPPPNKDRFSGTYTVTDTTHTHSESGYTTDFSARMEAQVSS